MRYLKRALSWKFPKFILLNEKYFEETVDFATSVFVKEEPLTVHLKLTKEEARAEIRAVCEIALKENSGVIAVDPSTDRVIAFLIAKDFTTQLPQGLSPKLEPIFDLMSQMSEQFLRSRPVKRGEVCHIYFLGASTAHLKTNRFFKVIYRGRLALQLIRASEIQGRKLGYRHYYGECTNRGSQRVVEFFTNNVVAEIDYSSYVFRKTGDRVFSGIQGEKCVAYLVSI
jgi:hypothetical protein